MELPPVRWHSFERVLTRIPEICYFCPFSAARTSALQSFEVGRPTDRPCLTQDGKRLERE